MCVRFESSLFWAFSGCTLTGLDIVNWPRQARPMSADIEKKALPISKPERNVEFNLIVQMALLN